MSEEFRANNGDIIQLQFLPRTDGRRYNVTVLGFLKGHSLIVAAPKKDGHYMILREGQIFTARIMHNINVSGFQTQVIKAVSTPYPYMHLKIPSEFETKQVRDNERASVELGIKVSNIKKLAVIKNVDAMLKDLSLLGCKIVSPHQLGSIEDTLKLNMKMELFEHEFLISISSVIRSAEEISVGNQPLFQYGLSFKSLSAQDSLLIGSYVNKVLINKYME